MKNLEAKRDIWLKKELHIKVFNHDYSNSRGAWEKRTVLQIFFFTKTYYRRTLYLTGLQWILIDVFLVLKIHIVNKFDKILLVSKIRSFHVLLKKAFKYLPCLGLNVNIHIFISIKKWKILLLPSVKGKI